MSPMVYGRSVVVLNWGISRLCLTTQRVRRFPSVAIGVIGDNYYCPMPLAQFKGSPVADGRGKIPLFTSHS